MQFEERIFIKASPEQIFSAYKDVSGWSNWDLEVQASSIEGEFKSGAIGTLKPAKGPETKIVFSEVTRDTSFTTTSKLPFCIMIFEHNLVPSGEGTEVTHKVVFSGLLSFLFGRLIGAGIKRGLPSTMQTLKNAMESKH